MENGTIESSDIRIEEWIVVQTAAGQYLGRLAREGWEGADDPLLEAVKGAPIKLDIAFEFATPTTQRPDGAMNRGAFVMPIGLTGHSVPFYVTPVSAYACAELHEDDRAVYAEIVKKGLQMQGEFRTGRTRAPAQRSGLIVG